MPKVLVKWWGLPYDGCTWEHLDVHPELPALLLRYQEWSQTSIEAAASPAETGATAAKRAVEAAKNSGGGGSRSSGGSDSGRGASGSGSGTDTGKP
jgi:uncharacterized membrane protein YgcG